MLRKRTTENTPPGHKRRRTDHLHMAYREHQSPTLAHNRRKRKAEGEPSHQPTSKRHQSTAHWDEKHPPGNQGNPRPKLTYEDTTEHVRDDSPQRKIRRTQRLRRRPYPRPTSWVHDPSQDRDTEPNRDEPHPQWNEQPKPHHRGTWSLRSTTLCCRSCRRHHHPTSPMTTYTNTRETRMTVNRSQRTAPYAWTAPRIHTSVATQGTGCVTTVPMTQDC